MRKNSTVILLCRYHFVFLCSDLSLEASPTLIIPDSYPQLFNTPYNIAFPYLFITVSLSDTSVKFALLFWTVLPNVRWLSGSTYAQTSGLRFLNGATSPQPQALLHSPPPLPSLSSHSPGGSVAHNQPKYTAPHGFRDILNLLRS